MKITKNADGLTWRALILSAFGSLLISASSMVVALRLSALPWPTVFVSVLSMAVLNLFGKSNIHEINIAQTGMSAGAMIAGGLAFTLPGLWIAGLIQPAAAGESFSHWAFPKLWPLFALTLGAVLVGSCLSLWTRRRSILEEKLPYPIGQAAAETLMAGDSGGSKAKLLFGTLGFAAIFTLARDYRPTFKALPGLLPASLDGKLVAYPLGLSLSPMALGIGYLIGFMPTLWWLGGALAAHWVLGVMAVQLNFFADAAAASGFTMTAAIGLMVGSGLAILLRYAYERLRQRQQPAPASDTISVKQGTTSLLRSRFVLISLVLAVIGLLAAGLNPWVCLLVLIGAGFSSVLASSLTGRSGINPMEIFGIIVLLAIRLIIQVSDYDAFLVAAAVAIASGFAGDLLNDYKMGDIIGTDPKAQLISQLVGAAVGSFVALLTLFALLYQHGSVGGDSGLSAAQAFNVASMVQGIGSPLVFTVALIAGIVLFLLGIPAMVFGIGMLLPINLGFTIFIGGLLHLLIKKVSPNSSDRGQLIAAGLLGGEGLLSTVLALIGLTQLS